MNTTDLEIKYKTLCGSLLSCFMYLHICLPLPSIHLFLVVTGGFLIEMDVLQAAWQDSSKNIQARSHLVNLYAMGSKWSGTHLLKEPMSFLTSITDSIILDILAINLVQKKSWILCMQVWVVGPGMHMSSYARSCILGGCTFLCPLPPDKVATKGMCSTCVCVLFDPG